MYISRFLLMRSSDCELNRGPRTPKYPCQICSKACRWGQRAIACDNCDQRYHVNCLGMASQNYNYHAQTDVSWICCTCGLPNFSTSLFESLVVDTSNVFDSLNVDEYNRQHNTPRVSTTYLLTKKRTKEQTRKPTTQFSYYIIEYVLRKLVS